MSLCWLSDPFRLRPSPCSAPARPCNIYWLKGSQGTPESWRGSQFTAGRSALDQLRAVPKSNKESSLANPHTRTIWAPKSTQFLCLGCCSPLDPGRDPIIRRNHADRGRLLNIELHPNRPQDATGFHDLRLNLSHNLSQMDLAPKLTQTDVGTSSRYPLIFDLSRDAWASSWSEKYAF